MGGRNWQGGSERQWRYVRAGVLAANKAERGGVCALMLAGCTGLATCVHHVAGKDVTGNDSKWLVASCTHCNTTAGDPRRTAVGHKVVTEWD
jgi:hypothetical protein